MEAVGHDIIQDSMRQVMRQEMGEAEWEHTDLKFADLAKSLGMSDQEAKALSSANNTVGDVIRKIGNVFQIGEAKTVGESSSGVPKFIRDIDNLQDLFKRTGTTDMKVMAKMYAGATRGNPERVLEDKKTEDYMDVGYEEIGEPVRQAITRSFQKELPAMQQELQTLLIDTTPGAAKAHIEQLLYLIEEELRVLEAHSLPDFWVKIGVPQWIRTSAISYVNTLQEEMEAPLKSMLGEEVITGVTPPESGEESPTMESARIFGLLTTMDSKLDSIDNKVSTKSGDAYGGLIGSMRSYEG